MNTEYFLCSEGLINSLDPIEKSEYVLRFGDKVAVAVLDFEKVKEFFNDLSETQKAEYDFWCQQITSGYIDMTQYDFSENIFKWIYETHDLSQMNNHCIAIANLSSDEGVTPIELFNKLSLIEEK